MATTEISTVKAIPRLRSLYEQGLLVPFIGAGMSVPVCTGWTAFLKNLACKTRVPWSANAESDDGAKYRLADKVVSRLMSQTVESAAAVYRDALISNRKDPEGTHTETLAKLYWPLVVSTNYDDLYCAAARRRDKKQTSAFYSSNPKGGTLPGPEVAGRNPADCIRVLRSLDHSGPSLLWAVQGFLGGIVTEPDEFVKTEAHSLELARQVVVGHQQYQRVINAEHHFRRAFAEVCRRRSLLFLGSGISEDYVLNLFSEVIHHHGASAHGHYALFPEKRRGEIDVTFLSVRLGIVPVFYEMANEHDHSGLSKFIENLEGKHAQRPRSTQFSQREFEYCIENDRGRPLAVKIAFKGLPQLRDKRPECAWLVSVGRDDENRPKLGEQAKSLMPSTSKEEWRGLDGKPSFVYRNIPNPNCFAVAARDPDMPKSSRDMRALATVPSAFCKALQIVGKEYSTLFAGAVASGRSSYCHPVHPFVQMLRGVRMFLTADASSLSKLEQLSIHVVHPGVWADILAGKIPVGEHLTSDVSAISVEVNSPEPRVEFYTLTMPTNSTIRTILEHLELEASDWNWSLYPPPDERGDMQILADEPVLPTMNLRLFAKERTSLRRR